MLGTIILDAYRDTERTDMAAALDELCAPDDNCGWASAGVYCFWHRIEKTILYIGLSMDLARRFREHNGAPGGSARGNKAREIDAYFRENEYLGFSILVQSPMAQPLSMRALAAFGAHADEVRNEYGDLVQHGREAVVRAEGIWIEAHRLKFGWKPPWNRIGGSSEARAHIGPSIAAAFDIMTGRADSLIAARHTLRELAQNPVLEGTELFLHGARQIALPWGGDVLRLLERLPDGIDRRGYIRETQYLRRRPIVPGPSKGRAS